MSQDKLIYEAQRWLDTAAEDLDEFSHACFFAQQCGEKALKALWYFLGEDPWGDSIQKLIAELPDEKARETMADLLETGSALDRYYLPTRYPNGLPDLTPGKYYFQKDADLAIGSARRILDSVKACVGLR